MGATQTKRPTRNQLRQRDRRRVRKAARSFLHRLELEARLRHRVEPAKPAVRLPKPRIKEPGDRLPPGVRSMYYEEGGRRGFTAKQRRRIIHKARTGGSRG